MDRTAATHAAHDEMLIVRLFGGDVSDSERTRALELMGDCDDCAALFVELGATADAAAALPVPARPRDFILTEADAARLTRRGPFGRLAGVRTVRALGRSLVALGILGVVATGSLSLLTTSAPGSATLDQNASAGPARFAEGSQHAGGQSYGPPGLAASASVLPGFLATAASADVGPTEQSPTDKQATDAPVATILISAGQTPVPVTGPTVPDYTGSVVNGGGTIDSLTTSGGIDSRLLWLAGFATLFVLGLALLAVPLVLRRRAR